MYLRQDSKQFKKTWYEFWMGIHLVPKPIHNTTIPPVLCSDVDSQCSHCNANLQKSRHLRTTSVQLVHAFWREENFHEYLCSNFWRTFVKFFQQCLHLKAPSNQILQTMKRHMHNCLLPCLSTRMYNVSNLHIKSTVIPKSNNNTKDQFKLGRGIR